MPTPFQLFVAAASARTYPRVAWMFRHRTWLLQETLLPLLAVSALAFTYEAMMVPAGGRPADPGAAALYDAQVATAHQYIGLLILGQAMSTFWLNVLWSMGAHLYWERDSGNLELYIMSPAPLMSILAGMALGGLTTTVVRAGVILAAGALLFQVSFAPSSWWLLALIFGLTMASLYGLGMMFASLFLLWGREAWHTVNLLQEPVYLLTGMNFPLKALQLMVGWALPGVALLIPLTAGMDAMRQVLFRDVPGFLPVWDEVAILAGLAAVFLFFARRTLRLLERKAKEEGRLTVKWQ